MKIRQATNSDVVAIVGLLANDALGKQREDYKLPLPDTYFQAFNEIDADQNQEFRQHNSKELQNVDYQAPP